ncbi:MAG: hypothetical protein Kow0027_22640 [Saprospiraceae bacterium]
MAQAEDCCTDGNKIAAMTITYTGEDCSATSHNQNPDKVTCNGDPAGKQAVHIIVNNKQNPDEGDLFFEGDVQLGTPFTVEAATAGKDEFKAETWFHIFDDQWNLLQEVRFHTSCSQPIAAGNQFGSIRIDKLFLTDGTSCSAQPPSICTGSITLVRWDWSDGCNLGSQSGNWPPNYINGTACAFEVSNLKRDEGSNSCIDGLDNDSDDNDAVCFDKWKNDEDDDDNEDRTLYFEISFDNGESGQLTAWEFYQMAPPIIDNDNECNNYPESIRVRVLKNNVQIIEQYIDTDQQAWKKESISFPGNTGNFSGGDSYRFEIIGFDLNYHCGSNPDARAFGLDNMELKGCCGDTPPPGCDPCEFAGKIENDEAECGPFDPETIVEVEVADCDNTPPPPPPLMDCCPFLDHDLVRITARYTGQDCNASYHDQDSDKASCEGNPGFAPYVHIIASEKEGGNGDVWFDGWVNLDDTFVIDAEFDNEDDLASNTWVDIYSPSGQLLQRVKFHTSCSQPLGIGNQFGGIQIVEIEDEDGQFCGNSGNPSNDCCPFLDHDLVRISIQYTGEDCSASNHNQDSDKVSCEGDPGFAPYVHIVASEKEGGNGDVWFDGWVNLDETFVIDAEFDNEDDLASNTWVDIYSPSGQLLQRVKFHTSCSQPLGIGNQFGSLLILEIEDEDGLTCGQATGDDDDDPQGSQDCCDSGEKIAQLTMTYTGEDCSATSHNQDPDKVSCDGDPNDMATVHIVASEKKGGDGKVWFEGDVNLGEQFTLDAANANESRLKSNTWVDIYSPSGQLLQRVQFHTSCSQPLSIGNQFGSLTVDFIVFEDGSNCGPPPPPPTPDLEYQWLASTNGCPDDLSQAIPGATERDYDPGYITQTTWYVRLVRPKDCEGNDDAWTASNCIEKRVVNLDVDFLDISCDDNGTFDPADDLWSFGFKVTGSGNGWNATAYSNVGVLQFSGDYGETITMGPFKIADGPITIDLEDQDLPDCHTSNTLMPPPPCSQEPPKASLGDYVWNDLNKNGKQDLGEPGVDGVKVTLHKCDGTFVAEQFTANGGLYLFTDLAPDMHYYVVFSDLPADFIFTSQNAAGDAVDSDADPNTGRTECTFLSPGEEDRTWDAGLVSTAPVLGKLGDYVWFDANGNGIQEQGEPGMGDIFVILEDCNGNYLDFTITDAYGMYMFSDLEAGDYTVRFANPGDGYFGFPIKLTVQDAGNDDTVDSDADWLGRTPCITLGPGEVNLTIDAGFTGEAPQCTLTPEVTNIECIDNGTPDDPSDDIFKFTLTVYGVATGAWGFDVAETGEQMLAYGVPHVMGPFPISEGDLTLTLCDHDVIGCCTTVTVTPPAACSTPVCDNVTNAGLIGNDESHCGTYDPEPIVSLEDPSGGSGDIEYVWLSSTEGCPWDASQAIPNSNSPTYDPGEITQTTWFLRCARRVGCDTFIESNCVVKEVVTDCGGGCNITLDVSPGTITIGGLTAPNVIVHVFDASNWATVFSCFNNCDNPQVVGNLPGGTYYVKVELFGASWEPLCDRQEYVNVPGNMIIKPVVTGPQSHSAESARKQQPNPAIQQNGIQLRSQRQFALVPNPAGEFVKVLWETGDYDNLEIIFFNQLGQQVKTVKLDDGNTGEQTIDIASLQSGTYLVQLRSNNTLPLVKRLVISH